MISRDSRSQILIREASVVESTTLYGSQGPAARILILVNVSVVSREASRGRAQSFEGSGR